MSSSGETRRGRGQVAGLVVLAVVCVPIAFYGFVMGMVCEPDAGVGCDGDSAARTRQLGYAAALAASAVFAGAVAAIVKPKTALVVASCLAGLAAMGYAITQVN